MSGKEFKAGKGARFSNSEAQVFGEVIHRERITRTEDLLQFASLKKAPPVLHDYFQWDDEKAGHEYRLWQARHIFNHLVEVREDETEVKAVHSVITGVYEETEVPVAEYETHDHIKARKEYQEQLFKSFYNRILLECEKAESLGAMKQPRWRRLIVFVRKNSPMK